ncbi:hypothetical protein EJA72_15275 [Pseudomonas sp. PB120]|nr:hypothetical protein [Pseudomonas sp. PB120]
MGVGNNQLLPATPVVLAFVARELAPAGLRSGPLHSCHRIRFAGFTTAAQPSGSKPPHHRDCAQLYG